MKALVIVALVLANAGSARAENEVLGSENGPWIVGASVQYIRDGREGFIGNFFHEGPTGLGYGLEVGRTLLPWVSASLTYRLAHLSEEDIWTDPGSADFTERQHRLGARIDLWPLPGRLRMGAAVVRTWRRSEMSFNRPATTYVDHDADNTYELHLGVVPVRWHGWELEISGSFAREPTWEHLNEGQLLSTFTVGLGLRWRTGGA